MLLDSSDLVEAKASAHKAKAWTFEAGQGHENMASRHVKAKAWARPERTMFSLGKKSRLAMFSLASCHGGNVDFYFLIEVLASVVV